jgi:hypothetical protein
MNFNEKGGSATRLSNENLRGRTVIAPDGQGIGEIAASISRQ